MCLIMVRAELAQFAVWERVRSLGDPVHEPVLVFGFDSVSPQLGDRQTFISWGFELVNRYVTLLITFTFYTLLYEFFSAEAVRVGCCGD